MPIPVSPPGFTLAPSSGGLPKVTLMTPDGARGEIFLYGAHVSSWIPAGGSERLFLSRAAEFHPGAAIRGGVPVIFPQFSGQGPLPNHGFARMSPWKFGGVRAAGEGGLLARFSLGETASSHALWPHPFQAWLEVALGGRQLSITLRVENSGEASFQFTAALHTYLQIGEISAVRLGGLEGVHYLDKTAGGAQTLQAGPWLAFAGEVDRVYLSPTGPLRLEEAGRPALRISAVGFPDVVTWNPGPIKAASVADLEQPDGWRRFVCVEAAAAGAPVSLAPGDTWQGSQTLEEI